MSDYNIGLQAAIFRNGSLTNGNGGFIPDPSIAHDNADVYLFFLSVNAIVFDMKTTDEWYHPTHTTGRSVLRSDANNEPVPAYVQDEPASPLGCVSQEQLCNPRLPEGRRCTQLLGSADVFHDGAELFGESRNDDNGCGSAMGRIWWAYNSAFHTAKLPWVVSMLGSRSLLSRFGLHANMQGPLPDNQWQLDVKFWQDTVLALIQDNFVAAARGQSDDPQLDDQFMSPDGPDAKALCRNQKIRSTAYVSFSLLGLVLIFGLGALIVLVALILEPLVAYIQCRWRSNHGQYARLEWAATGTLQLQRLAHEELGFGGAWTGAAETVPVTAPGELLAMLDVKDSEHPRLLRKEGADVCGEAEKVEEQGGEEVGGAKEGGDGEVGLRVTVQHTQGSSFSGGSEETVGREEGIWPTEVVTREA